MKKLISFIVIISLLITSQSAQATFFTDLFGGLFTVVSYPFQLLLGSTKAPFFVSQNPFVEKEWHKSARLAATQTPKFTDQIKPPEEEPKPPEEPQSPTATPIPQPKDSTSEEWWHINLKSICLVALAVEAVLIGALTGAVGAIAVAGTEAGAGVAVVAGIGAVLAAATVAVEEGLEAAEGAVILAFTATGAVAVAAGVVALAVKAGIGAVLAAATAFIAGIAAAEIGALLAVWVIAIGTSARELELGKARVILGPALGAAAVAGPVGLLIAAEGLIIP